MERLNSTASYGTVISIASQIGPIALQNLPVDAIRKRPRHPVPFVILARLAIEQAAQGQGFGETLLIDALRRTLALSDALDIHVFEVDAIDAQAKAFYERYGFMPPPASLSHDSRIP